MLTRQNKMFYVVIPAGLLLLFVVYYHTFVWMYERWMAKDTYYSHGFLVPLISGYLIWSCRDRFSRDFDGKLDVHYWGAMLLFLGLIIHALASLIGVYFVSGFSILPVVLGITLFWFGRTGFTHSWFPTLFLSFMIPLPLVLVNFIGFPLKMLVAKFSAGLLYTFGLPIYREGFQVYIPNGTLTIDNPCSGLRSLIALLALGAVVSWYVKGSVVKRTALFLSMIPISIFANVIRVMILILLAHFLGMEAADPESVYHTGTGLLVFAVSFFLLILLSRIADATSTK